ncbi:ferredoxin [Skermania piniformis]|uniref:Ferredoxin n=1 Tax=Skermania pinensis TaxID=39122 RepID=A0ABX8SI03_9ACTN|nr:ferredoxin [Skermania piniformis]QXQ15316.1 ferredoxin [Skermania piniformis]
MKVTIDTDRCRGHGACLSCFEVFTLNPDGYADAISDPIPDELVPDVREAVAACPEQAIVVVE